MKLTKKARHLLIMFCMFVTIMTFLDTLFKRLKGHSHNNAIHQMVTSVNKTRNDFTFNGYIRSWIDRNLNQSGRGETVEPSQPPLAESGSILIDRRIAQEVSEKVKVLCWIPTREIHRNTRLWAINSTWTRRCDKVIYFISTPKIKQNDVIKIPINDSRKTLTDKTVYAHEYIYQHYLDNFDWFLKADDDTYIIMENLKFLLSHFDTSVPGYIGCQFKHYAPQGYMSGGASYAFNSEGLKTLVENGYRIPGRCRHQGGAEDIETGRCAYKAGIRTLDQLDMTGKQTFFPSNVYSYAMGPTPQWAVGYARAKSIAGMSCCSPLPVSFHYTGYKLMIAMEFLLYRVVVHGRREIISKAEKMFNGRNVVDMTIDERRQPYPGEKLDDYYKPGWREKNTTIYNKPAA